MLILSQNSDLLLQKARDFAKAEGLTENLEKQIQWLETFGCPPDGSDPDRAHCHLHADFAPHSFAFTVQKRMPDGSYDIWVNGGLIFHGPADGFGSGAGPAFAVTLTATRGWAIHT